MEAIIALTVLCFTGGLAQPVAWSARLKDPMLNVPTQSQVVFSETTANTGNWYDAATGIFTVPEDKAGTYFMAMSIGVPMEETAQIGVYTIGGVRQYVGLRYNNPNTDGVEYASRSYLRTLGGGLEIEMRTDADSSLLGLPYYTTAWNMFRYAQPSDYTIAFSVSRNTNLYGFTDVIPWQRQFVNDGGTANVPFNMTTGFFTALIDGYYFFTISAGSVAEQPMQAALSVWPAAGGEPPLVPICSLNRTARNSLGLDTTARSIMLPLSAGDQVAVGNGIGSALGSNYNTLQTSFSGFGYALDNPDSEEAVAFCAFMENWSWAGAISATLENWSGTTVNLAFSGEPFDLASGIFTIPVDGTYFFSFSVGVEPLSNVIVSLTDNLGYEAARIDRRNRMINGIDTLSRDVIVDLVAGQNMRLQVGSGFSLQSSQYGRETSFMGLRIRDIDEP